ncbi:MAG: hypothetical protein P8H21_07780 [Woeseiaceae bacterium]|nr:hypothetical protein [Woeseiaceae bacterium]
MNKLNFLIKLYYPVNALFTKLLPKTRLFIVMHKYFLHLIDSKRHELINEIALKELELLLKTKHKKVTLVWDCLSSPVTYGDFIDFCMFARYVKSINYEIIFYIAADKFRNDWNAVYPNLERKEWFLNELKSIGEYFLDGTKINIQKKFSEINLDRKYSYTPFLKNICSRSDPHVFKYATLMTEIQQIRMPSQEFLLKSYNREQLFNIENYITWHIRGSSVHSSAEDEKPEDILEFYKIISSSTDLPILVISSHGALPYLKNILGNKNNVFFSKDSHKGFLSDVKLIMGSKLYIQCGWGGMWTFPVCSDLPFIGPPIERSHAPWERLKMHVKNDFKIRPWASNQQHTFSDIEDFKSKLKLLVSTLNI